MTTLDMSPIQLNIKGVRAGDANRRTFVLLAAGQPWDLTGATIQAQARLVQTEPDPPALTAEVTVVDAPAGRFEVAWPGADVEALLAGALTWTGYWDLEVAFGAEPPVTVLAGSFSCDADVTR